MKHGNVIFHCIAGTTNYADMITKLLGPILLKHHIDQSMGCILVPTNDNNDKEEH